MVVLCSIYIVNIFLRIVYYIIILYYITIMVIYFTINICGWVELIFAENTFLLSFKILNV